jgi:hypothetical protein
VKPQLAFILSIFTFIAQLAVTPAFAETVAPSPQPLVPVQPTNPTSSPTVLTVKDLPPGYKEVPPEFKKLIAAQLEPFYQILTKENLPLNNFFAFIEPQKMEVVMGLTGILLNQAQQAKFDTALKQVQTPEFQQQITKLGKKLKSAQGVEILGYKELPEFNNLGNASTGLSLDTKIQETPVKFDVVGFRRDRLSAFTAVLYPTGNQPSVSVKDMVTKLDARPFPSKPAINLPPQGTSK